MTQATLDQCRVHRAETLLSTSHVIMTLVTLSTGQKGTLLLVVVMLSQQKHHIGPVLVLYCASVAHVGLKLGHR